MSQTQISPWSVFEVEDGSDSDYLTAFTLSSDGKTLTVKDTSATKRNLLRWFCDCNPGDILEFQVEAALISGSPAMGIQPGTLSLQQDAMGAQCRGFKYINGAGEGFKLYKTRIVVPDKISTPITTWWVGCTYSGTGEAKYRNPKMFINGTQVGLNSIGLPSVGKNAVSNNYISDIMSKTVKFTQEAQHDGYSGFVGSPLFFVTGSVNINRKIIGSDFKSSSLCLCNFAGNNEDLSGAGVRTLKSPAEGPGLSADCVADGSSVGWFDACYWNGSAYKRAGRVEFFYRSSDQVVFNITTPNLNNNEDANGLLIWKSGAVSPKTDGTADCGTAAHRWNVVRATTGSINTSDIRAKDNLEAPSDALMRAWGKVNFKVFQMRDAIAEKGADKARLHVGVIAQEVQAAFASEGLDASRYGLFCYDKWEDEYETETVVDVEEHVDVETGEIVPAQTHNERHLVRPAGDLYAIRYEEALALECAYQRWLGEQRDARIAALEAKLAGAGE